MSLTLLIDTTWTALMLGLAKDSEMIGRVHDVHPSHRYHSAILLPRIVALLQDHGFTPQDLTGIGVNCGPGSFTGIRSGLTVARLMGQFMPVTLYGFDTFSLLAADPAFTDSPVTVLMNAYRQQHYRASLQVGIDGEVGWLDAPQVEPNAAVRPLTTPVCLMDPSLQAALGEHFPQARLLDETTLFTPDRMLTLLRHHPEAFVLPWTELRPLYLQLPHITLSSSARQA